MLHTRVPVSGEVAERLKAAVSKGARSTPHGSPTILGDADDVAAQAEPSSA
jgi:hypothetical protein